MELREVIVVLHKMLDNRDLHRITPRNEEAIREAIFGLMVFIDMTRIIQKAGDGT